MRQRGAYCAGQSKKGVSATPRSRTPHTHIFRPSLFGCERRRRCVCRQRSFDAEARRSQRANRTPGLASLQCCGVRCSLQCRGPRTEVEKWIRIRSRVGSKLLFFTFRAPANGRRRPNPRSRINAGSAALVVKAERTFGLWVSRHLLLPIAGMRRPPAVPIPSQKTSVKMQFSRTVKSTETKSVHPRGAPVVPAGWALLRVNDGASTP
jgi:hypothetical protein